MGIQLEIDLDLRAMGMSAIERHGNISAEVGGRLRTWNGPHVRRLRWIQRLSRSHRKHWATRAQHILSAQHAGNVMRPVRRSLGESESGPQNWEHSRDAQHRDLLSTTRAGPRAY